jgi:hypothetical protein
MRSLIANLKLWKVTICTKVTDNKMNILRTKAHDKFDVGKDLEDVLLKPDDEISDLFDKQPDINQYHRASTSACNH